MLVFSKALRKYGSSSSLINREELKSKIKRFLDHI
jgi:hypothetical protein